MRGVGGMSAFSTAEFFAPEQLNLAGSPEPEPRRAFADPLPDWPATPTRRKTLLVRSARRIELQLGARTRVREVDRHWCDGSAKTIIACSM
jgi:hypothetical protein